MTIAEAERFYSTDRREYELNSNTKFLKCYDIVKDFAHYSIEDLQEFIDSIFFWYEIKYPNFYFERIEGTFDERFEGVKNIDEDMSFTQLMMRNSRFFNLINGINYISQFYPIYDKSKEEPLNRIYVELKIESCYIKKSTLKELGMNQKLNITIEELEEKLKKSNTGVYDFSEISKYICIKNVNRKLRDVALSLVLLKLLYSRNTIPEYGYERAKKLIKEFNEEIPYLNLESTHIDEIINRGYSFEGGIILDSNEVFVPDEINDGTPRVKS